MNHLTHTIKLALAVVVTVSAIGASNSASVYGQQKTETTRTRSGRDPFSKYVPPRVVVRKTGPLMPPTIQERIAQYKAQKQAAMSARVAAPKPTTAFLLSELQVVGISRSPRGYAAIVEATPIKLAYVIYPGERFYDGQLVAIEDNRLVFRRETVYADGKRERSVEMKPLRQASTVDALATTKTTPATTAPESNKKSDSKPTAEKP
jgi:hypothetical protein